MRGFTAAEAVRQMSEAIGRPVDVVIANTAPPSKGARLRYAFEHKALLPVGDIPAHCDLVAGEFWSGDIARHDRRRLAYAVWSVISRKALAQGM